MNKTLDKLFAFLKRDFLEAASYKFAFVYSLVGIFFSSATFFFISKIISGQNVSSLRPYGGDYFSFVIIGIAFSGILGVLQEGLPAVIRSAQVAGTLEALLVTQTRIQTILLGSSLYSFFFTTLRSGLHLLLAIAVFGMKLGDVNWAGGILVFFLTAVCYLSVGILSASFILVYKAGNPFNWIFGSVSGLLGGVFFPIAVLPSWVRWISYALPVTHSLEGMRLSLLSSASLSQVAPHILILAAFGAVLLPVSLVCFRFAIKKAKKDGSLIQY